MPEPPAAVASSSAPPLPWAPPGLATLVALDASARPLPGHGAGRYQGRRFASDRAARRATPAPPGLVLCAEHTLTDDGGPGPTLCMRREAEGWRHGVMLPGQPGWAREGVLDECRDCHSTAPHDGRFDLDE